MKRRRRGERAVLDISSDESSDDFAPSKLKSKRISIVLTKNPSNSINDKKSVQPKPLSRLSRKRNKKSDSDDKKSKESSIKSESRRFLDLSCSDDSLLIAPNSEKKPKLLVSKSKDNGSGTKGDLLDISSEGVAPEPSTTNSLPLGNTENATSGNGSESVTAPPPDLPTGTPSAPTASTESEQGGPAIPKVKPPKVVFTSPKTRNGSGNLGYSFCQMCHKNITSYSPEKRQLHVNRCCDKFEGPDSEPHASTTKTKPNKPAEVPARSDTKTKLTKLTPHNCVFCTKSYSEKRTLRRHLKECCVTHGEDYEKVCVIVFGQNSTDLPSKPRSSRRAKKTEPKPPPPLITEKETALNRAQNRILDKVSEQVVEVEIPPTPVLKASHLTTYRSKRNSIWNVAGDANSNISTVLMHDNSIIATQKPVMQSAETTVSEDLSSTPVDMSICMDKTTLPTQADITQLTQFLQDLSKDTNIKERLSSLISSPRKVPVLQINDSLAQSSSSELDLQEEAEEREDVEKQDGGEEEELRKQEDIPIPEAVKSPEIKTILIKNSFKKRGSSASGWCRLTFGTASSTSGETSETVPLSSPEKSKDASDTPGPLSSLSPDVQAEGEDVAKESSPTKGDPSPPVSHLDHSPGPSDISAVGEDSLIRTPTRATSEMVSSIRESGTPARDLVELDIPSDPPVETLPDDSNLDLFTGDPGTPNRTEGDLDRSLLNVSPITDSGVDPGDTSLDKRASGKRRRTKLASASPVYRRKQCTSTKKDADTSCHRPQACKYVQAQYDTRCRGTGTPHAKTRNKSVETDLFHKTETTNTEKIKMFSIQTQADGEYRLVKLLSRLINDEKTADTTLLCTDDHYKKAHKLILDLTCPGLLSDGTNSIVELGVSGESADLFLEWLYTQQISSEIIRPEILAELNDIAHRYDLTELITLLHTKHTGTFEINLKQESGDTIHLNLSSRDLLHLTQQLEDVTSCSQESSLALSLSRPHQLKSCLDLTRENSPTSLKTDESVRSTNIEEERLSPVENNGKFETIQSIKESPRKDSIYDFDESNLGQSYLNSSIPSFQEHDFCHGMDDSTALGTSMRDSLIGPGGNGRGSPARCEEGQEGRSSREDDYLPASGIVLESPEEKPLTEEEKRATQLQQDVEFIDLVNQLDDTVGTASLSFIDSLSPIKVSQGSTSSLSPIELQTKPPLFSLKPSRSKSTPKPATKTRSNDTDISIADLSAYQKTPGFRDMNTPKLKSQVDKYGLKPLGRKKAVAKLEEIHRFTNKKFLKCPDDAEEDFKETPTKPKNKAKPKPKKEKRPKPSSSEDSGSEGECCPVGDITVSGKVPKNTVEQVREEVLQALRGHEATYCQVLQYVPVDILAIKGMMNMKTNLGLVAQILDEQGITFFNSKTKSKGFTGSKKGGSKKAKK